MKPCQHFICTEVMLTFIFSMKPREHLHLYWSCINIGLYNKVALAPIFRGNIAQTSRVHSTIARHQDFRDANKTLKMQGALIKTLKMQGDAIKTLKFQEAPIKTLRMQRDANKTLKMWEECRQDFDIARTCP